VGLGREEGPANMGMLMLLAVPRVIKFFVSDPGVLNLLPECME